MKTKNKMLAMVEIAIVLCSVLLVAMPSIAAEQNAQEVSASVVTTASEDDYVLGVYGNANEDDTIDMRDLTYVKLIFFGKKPETELSDAKYDGKINPLDFIQIKLIIVGKEKELTIVQYLGRPPDFTEKTVTVPMPIETIGITNNYAGEILCALGEQDKIIGVCNIHQGHLKPLLGDKTVIGAGFTWDIEKIIELNPDIVIPWAYRDWPDYEEQLNSAGITVVKMDFFQSEKYSEEIENLGWLLNKQERAEELINFEQQHLDLIEERVKDLEEEQKPRVYGEIYHDYRAFGPGSSNHEVIVACGGINIFDDIEGSKDIDPEEVIVRNPQVILKLIYVHYVPSGYECDDTGPMEEMIDDIMSRPGFDHIDAVKEGKVYLLSTDATPPSCIFTSYIAKWLHPELFVDMDPVDIHTDWFKRFLGIEYQGVFAYPTYPVI